jgi:hypothetical protein
VRIEGAAASGDAGMTGAGAGGTSGQSPVVSGFFVAEAVADMDVDASGETCEGWFSTGAPPVDGGPGCATMIGGPWCPGKWAISESSPVPCQAANGYDMIA